MGASPFFVNLGGTPCKNISVIWGCHGRGKGQTVMNDLDTQGAYPVSPMEVQGDPFTHTHIYIYLKWNQACWGAMITLPVDQKSYNGWMKQMCCAISLAIFFGKILTTGASRFVSLQCGIMRKKLSLGSGDSIIIKNPEIQWLLLVTSNLETASAFFQAPGVTGVPSRAGHIGCRPGWVDGYSSPKDGIPWKDLWPEPLPEGQQVDVPAVWFPVGQLQEMGGWAMAFTERYTKLGEKAKELWLSIFPTKNGVPRSDQEIPNCMIVVELPEIKQKSWFSYWTWPCLGLSLWCSIFDFWGPWLWVRCKSLCVDSGEGSLLGHFPVSSGWWYETYETQVEYHSWSMFPLLSWFDIKVGFG